MKHIDINDEFNPNSNKDRQWIRLKLRWFSLIYRKGGKCIKCGESDFNCLEFHHRDPTIKDDQISYLIMGYGSSGNKKSGEGWKKAKDEVDKCDLLCRNCHYEIHNNEIISKRKKELFKIANKDKCELCYYSKKQCLDFHHLYGKDFTIGMKSDNETSNNKGRKYIDIKDTELIKKEIDKCQILCKNCHKKVHTNKDRWDKWGNKLLEISKEYDGLNVTEYVKLYIKEHLEKIKKLYWDGYCITRICKEIKFNKKLYISFIKEIRIYNLERKPKEIKERKVRNTIDDSIIIALWNDINIKYIKDVAQALKISISLLKARINIIKKNNSNILDRSEFYKQFNTRKRGILNDKEIQMIELRHQGKTSKEVGEIIGMTSGSVRTIYSKFIKMGIIKPLILKGIKSLKKDIKVLQKEGERIKVGIIYKKEDKLEKNNEIERKIINLRKNGKTTKEIAILLNKNHTFIKWICLKYIKLGELTKYNRSSCSNMKIVELKNQGKSTKEIAEIMNISQNAVRLKYSRFMRSSSINR